MSARPTATPRGALRRLAPRARLLVGLAFLGGVLLLPLGTVPGLGLAVALPLALIALARPARRTLARAIGLGLVMFGPYLLLAPFYLPATPGAALAHDLAQALAVPAGVALRGILCLVVTATFMATLDAAELAAALTGLGLPPRVGAIAGQVIHQTATLARELARTRAALRLRAPGRPRLALIAALPHVTLLRLIRRADRVAAAMELRAFDGGAGTPSARPPFSRQDGVAVATTAALIALAIALRAGGLA